VLSASSPGLLARSAGVSLVAGISFLTIADAGWAHAIGVAFLLGFIVLGFVATEPSELARDAIDGRRGDCD
jgi:cytochrome d ubiquinol oxidase subunit II